MTTAPRPTIDEDHMPTNQVASTAAAWWGARFQVDDKREAFRASLEKRIVEALSENPRFLRLECDYDPFDMLLDAVRDSGIDCRGWLFSGDGVLPCKTRMRIKDGVIEVREGYGAPWEALGDLTPSVAGSATRGGR